ncbi:MAG: hypothetical protein H7X92_13360 [Chitinophagales bacterium]|nr:hypothetical protein [Hyphomicrobiales bacterium]
MWRAILIVSFALPGAAHAAAVQCTPLDTDIVSLGEKAARFYAMRSLNGKIEDEKTALVKQGFEVGAISPPKLDCKFFPNIINMDEWRCTGTARVCTKGANLSPRLDKRPAAGSPRLRSPGKAQAAVKPLAPGINAPKQDNPR